MPLVFPVLSQTEADRAISPEKSWDLPNLISTCMTADGRGIPAGCHNGRDPDTFFVEPMMPFLSAWVLGPLLAIYTLLFVLRIFLSWYPQLDTSRLPYALVIGMTEFLLQPTRKLIPPLGGVDMAPVVWVGLVTLLREVLLGQQGLLTMALH